MARLETLSLAEARRLAVRAAGLGRPRPSARGDRRHARRVLGDVRVIQIDSVNVLVRAQEMPLWSRLGDHDRSVLPRMAAGRELFEYWGHQASLIPAADEPLFRWRMADAQQGRGPWPGVLDVERRRRTLLDEIRAAIRERGPIPVSAIRPSAQRSEAWWGWDDTKRAFEYLLWCGEISAVRGPTFERCYDLRERMLPPEVLAAPTPARDDAQRELLGRAARALGVAWPRDLATYFMMRGPVARPHIAALVEAGEVVPVRVDGIKEPALVHREAAVPRAVRAATLLSPFDPLIWERTRTERLFGFRYRIEIYTPAPKRVHGYYVLPFLLGDRLVARVDLKADRKHRRLLVPAAHLELGNANDVVAPALAVELAALARWLDLDEIIVARRGDLSPALRAACRVRQ
jgi:hypothetical protein